MLIKRDDAAYKMLTKTGDAYKKGYCEFSKKSL